MQFDDAGFKRHMLAPAAIPATGRGFGIPLDRQNSVFAGAAASTVGPPHRRPIVFDKSGKRRANTPAAPEASRGVRPGRKPKTGPHKKTQKQGSVLPFGVLSKICRSRKHVPICKEAAPANRERPSRSLVLSGARQACGGCIDRRALGAVADHEGRCRLAARIGQLKKRRRAESGVARPKISGLQSRREGGRLDRRQP